VEGTDFWNVEICSKQCVEVSKKIINSIQKKWGQHVAVGPSGV